jgi:cathepsin B
MKFVLFALLIVSVLCNKEIVDYINSHDFGWKAQHYDRWDGWTMEDFRNYFNLRPSKASVIVNDVADNLPDSFSWETKEPNCDYKVRNQADCGSCWAFGLVEALGDRFCIFCSKNIKLAAQDPVSCDNTDYGCGGGYLNNAWEYATNTGIVLQSCFPYVSGDGHVPPCPAPNCPGTGSWTKYKASNPHEVTGETPIMTELYNKGPVEFSMKVYQDFLSYKTGIYQHKTGGFLGYHAIKGIGWGVQSGTKYWIIENSWGTSWGQQGIFWILKGTDECLIEDGVYAGDASC